MRRGIVCFGWVVMLCFFPLGAMAATVEEVKETIQTYYYGELPAYFATLQTIPDMLALLDDYSMYDEAANGYQQATVGQLMRLSTTQRVSSQLLSGQVGYIHIPTFTASTYEEVRTHWLTLQQTGTNRLIIDMRYNGGGTLQSAVQLLGLFPNIDAAYTLQTKRTKQRISPPHSFVQFPTHTYVLVNRYSASATEMIAAALVDQQAATVVGERTKGKGTVQTIFPYADGSALKLTTGEMMRVNGRRIHQQGVRPTTFAPFDQELEQVHVQLLMEQFPQ